MRKRIGNASLYLTGIASVFMICAGAKESVKFWVLLAPWKPVPEAMLAHEIHWWRALVISGACAIPLVVSLVIVARRQFTARWLAILSTGASLVLALAYCVSLVLLLRVSIEGSRGDPRDSRSLARYEHLPSGTSVAVVLNIDVPLNVAPFEQEGKIDSISKDTLCLDVERDGREVRMNYAGRMVREVRVLKDKPTIPEPTKGAVHRSVGQF